MYNKQQLVSEMAPVLYHQFFGFTSLKKRYCSPFRVDRNPSLGLYYMCKPDDNGLFSIKTDTIYWKDFSTSQYGDVFDLIKLTYNLNKDFEVYFKVFQEIDFDAEIDFDDEVNINKIKEVIPNKNKNQLYKYYDTIYDVSKDTVNRFNIQETLFLKLQSNDILIPSSFSMYWNTHLGGTTIYSPYDTQYKWSGIGNKTIEGLEQLPETGELLIITKALKEVVFLYEHFNIPAISHHESYVIDEQIMNDLKDRFDLIITYFDNDDTGKKCASKYKEKYNIDSHYFRWSKNITDGYEVDKDLCLKTFKQQQNEFKTH